MVDPTGEFCVTGTYDDGGCRGATPFRWAGEKYSDGTDHLNQWVPDLPANIRWGHAAAGTVNLIWGAVKVGRGIALLTGGTAATSTGILAWVGIPAQAAGAYEVTTGAAKLYRGGKQLFNLKECVPDGDNYGLGDATDEFVFGVIPFGAFFESADTNWLDKLGSFF